MSGFVTLTCPSCGGKLQITDDIDRFACGHCGNEHIVRKSGGIIALLPVVEGLEGVQRGTIELPPNWLLHGQETPPGTSLDHEICDMLKNGQKIQAIKHLRRNSRMGLREAKGYVEDLQASLRRKPDSPLLTPPGTSQVCMSEKGKIQVAYTKSGLRRYVIEVRHRRLNKYQVIRGEDRYVVEQKARVKMAEWDQMWERKQQTEKRQLERQQRMREIEEKKRLAIERTEEAQATISNLERVLAYTLEIDDAIDWESLKHYADYQAPKPKKPADPTIPREPQKSDPKYVIKIGLLDRIFSSRIAAKKAQAEQRFNQDYQEWRETTEKINALLNAQMQEYEAALSAWEDERAKYLKARDESNAAIDEKKSKYLNREPEAVLDYCDMVLSNSKYPDCFPQSYDLDYNPESSLLIVDYQLPSIGALPTVREVKYVQSRDEFSTKQIPKTQLNRFYDNLLYQIVLRAIHELYKADKVDALLSIVFNGYVYSIDPATGKEITPCVLSLQAGKDEFAQINLASVEPKACFKKLKGVGSSRLHSLAPVAPILKIERDDRRFVSPYAVVNGIQEGDNLAAMDWEDFEHLVRELFEQEFSVPGGEVKVTRASRDGGIDAVVFDPDPLRGGKIVIQAKRYTNTVGVSAVRDLYGTLLNEGASKGILVTTSNYGPDAYQFAKGKPLVLLNGSNLLHLLERHGHKARIDLQEAKKILTEQKAS